MGGIIDEASIAGTEGRACEGEDLQEDFDGERADRRQVVSAAVDVRFDRPAVLRQVDGEVGGQPGEVVGVDEPEVRLRGRDRLEHAELGGWADVRGAAADGEGVHVAGGEGVVVEPLALLEDSSTEVDTLLARELDTDIGRPGALFRLWVAQPVQGERTRRRRGMNPFYLVKLLSFILMLEGLAHRWGKFNIERLCVRSALTHLQFQWRLGNLAVAGHRHALSVHL